MTPKQLKSAKEVLEPLFMIYRLQGHDIEWYEEDETIEDNPITEEGLYITTLDGDVRHTLWIDIDVDEKGQYRCETDSDITWSKLKRLPNQIDYHVREHLNRI